MLDSPFIILPDTGQLKRYRTIIDAKVYIGKSNFQSQILSLHVSLGIFSLKWISNPSAFSAPPLPFQSRALSLAWIPCTYSSLSNSQRVTLSKHKPNQVSFPSKLFREPLDKSKSETHRMCAVWPPPGSSATSHTELALGLLDTHCLLISLNMPSHI